MAEESDVFIILASVSPRRKELLAKAGYKFTVCPSAIDESDFSPEGVSPCEYAKILALAKAKDVAVKFPNCLVLGADTVADFQGQVIGKAVDAKEAEEITRRLFSAPHKIITAIAIVRLSDDVEICESDTTTVYPKKLTDEQIVSHIKSKLWKDKAGAYAIRENGDEFVERIDGSLTNVMGLPMELLRRMLKKLVD